MEIWDLHCHLSGVPGTTPEARLGQLLEYAGRLGIARLCVFMGMEWSYEPSPEKMRQENDEVLRALRHFPNRAFGFVYLNPRHTQASLDELDRCEVLATWRGEGNPAIAVGQFGRGRVLAYTSDPAPLWGCNFVFWKQYARLWVNACRWLVRGS